MDMILECEPKVSTSSLVVHLATTLKWIRKIFAEISSIEIIQIIHHNNLDNNDINDEE